MNLYVFRKKKLRFICKERDREWEKGIEIGRKKATLTQTLWILGAYDGEWSRALLLVCDWRMGYKNALATDDLLHFPPQSTALTAQHSGWDERQDD